MSIRRYATLALTSLACLLASNVGRAIGFDPISIPACCNPKTGGVQLVGDWGAYECTATSDDGPGDRQYSWSGGYYCEPPAPYNVNEPVAGWELDDKGNPIACVAGGIFACDSHSVFVDLLTTPCSILDILDLYAVGGNLSGMIGTGLVLENNGGDPLTPTGNGSFVFSDKEAPLGRYSVTVATQPAGQTCTVTNGIGTVGLFDCTNIGVSCTPNPYTVGGTVSGLLSGTVVLEDNNGNTLDVGSNGAFSFTTAVDYDSPYAVTVSSQPVGQTCVVTRGTGTMGSANVTSVEVSCTPNGYTLGGSLSGLINSTVTLEVNGGDALVLSANGAFTFTTPVDYDTLYAVTVSSQPTGQTCVVTANGSAIMPPANLTTVGVTCTPNSYTVGGTLEGLINGSVTLQESTGGDSVTLDSDTTFTFGTSVAYNSPYSVTVTSQPVGQTCVVEDGSGTMGAAAAVIGVLCTPNDYTVGGSLSGLMSGSVALQDNGGDTLSVGANGSFTFATAVAYNSPYAVTVSAQPVGQTCIVANGSGTMGAGAVTSVSVTCAPNTYAVGGTVSGLIPGPFVLQDNGGDDLVLSANGSFQFKTAIAFNSPYAVTVANQPIGQTCVVSAGSGTMGAAPVTNVSVACTANTYPVLVGVSGLINGTITVQDNGGDNLSLSANGQSQFATPVAFDSSYAVTILSQPTGQTCVVVDGSGTMGPASAVTGVVCAPNTYAVGGTLAGLINGSLSLQDNGGDTLTLGANGSFKFATPVAYHSNYAVTISAQPVGQTCAVASGSGTMAAGAVTSVGVSCTPNAYAVGGNLGGLINGTLVLQDNGGDNLSVTANGSFTFATTVAYNSNYAVTISAQPVGQTCSVSSGSGTMGAGAVTNVSVSCAPNTYAVGGTLAGLLDGSVSLQDNGGDTLIVSANGAFTFATPISYNSSYAVTISAQPAGQTCAVTSGSGTMGAGAVTSVGVSCSPNAYTIGGTLLGLAAGESVVLQDNGTDTLTVSSTGAFTFEASVVHDGAYSVAVVTNPASPIAQTCGVSSGSGTVGASNVTSVVVICTTNTYSVGGTATGLTGGNLVLQDNTPSNTVTASANGAFSFTLASGSTYNVTLSAQPAGQDCTVTGGGSGTVAAANVTNVAVSCVANTVTASGDGNEAIVVAVDLSSAFNTDGIVLDGDANPTGGLDNGGDSLSANLLGVGSAWASGTVGLAGGLPFNVVLPTTSDVANSVISSGQVLNLPVGSYSSLSFLATNAGVSNQGQQALVFTVTYTDGSTAVLTQSMSDVLTNSAYPGETLVATTAYLDTGSGGARDQAAYLYQYSIALDSTKTVATITLPGSAGAAAGENIFAMVLGNASGETVTVNYGSTQSFTVAANAGYTLSTTVGGTCAAGPWSGDVYTTGAVDGPCTVTFSATPNACAAETTSNCVLTETTSSGASGSCASGYGVGSCSYSCDAAVWTEVSNTCAPAPCSAAAENSDCNVSDTSSGDLSGSCASGFGAGSCSYSCGNGTWTEVSDTCAPAACTAVTENSNCDVSGTNSGGTSGSCANGFGAGSCSYSCSNGSWTEVSDTCAPAPCSAATEHSNCDVSGTNSGGTSGSCASGFGAGSCSYSCSNGAWTQVSDTCAPADCTAATENGNCNVSSTTSGGTSGSCASGFGAGSCSYSCTNGAWTESSDTCAPAACTAETDDNCALATTTSGSSSGACTTGYTGSCSYSCSNGTWSQASDSCALGCIIGGTLYAAGASNPSTSCEVCTPSTSTSAWSAASAGTSCGSGEICTGALGACAADCYIGGALIASGTLNPSGSCQQCVPSSSTTQYSAVANGTNTSTCLASSGDVCESGACVCNGTGGLVACDGVCVSESNDPNNCGACGNKCATGQVCASGVCSTAFANSEIAVGATFACAVVNGGQVKCWGATSQYSTFDAYLGDGSTTGSTTPVTVTGITTAKAVFAAAFNACALLGNGSVECWGDNSSGQLGDGTTTSRTSPVAVSGLTNAVAVAGNTDPGGPSFSCAVESTGGVVCWGDNTYGELGNGTTTSSHTPVSVTGLSNAIAIATGANFACALKTGGTVVCWGSDADGALGNDVSSGNYSTPVAVSGVTNAVGIAADYQSACAVLSSGDVVCWGDNGEDQLGDGNGNNSLTPVDVSGLDDGTAIVACDGSSVSTLCAATTAGTAYCWGNNVSGQLGNGTTNDSDVPVQVKGLSGAVQVAVGGGAGSGQASACALLSDGTVECWGSNEYGQLGNGTNNSSLSLVSVIDL